jgi:hypothetical protein
MKSNSSHIEFERLADLIEGRASQDERSALMAHISSCPQCSGTMNEIEQTINLMKTDASEDAPHNLIAAALQAFRSRIIPQQSGLRRVLAALKFDSLSLTPAFGLRSSVQTERQLIFSAGDNELQLQVSPAGEEWTIAGQVLGPCSGGNIELRGAGFTERAELNALCEFTFSPVASGNYALTFQIGEVSLYIPDLRLGD